MKPNISMRRSLADKNLLGGVLAGESWAAWRVLLIASVGEALTDDERVIFTKLTGREREPMQRCEELICIIGRRGGKSRAVSTLAAYIAALCTHDALVPGETGVVLCVAPDLRQANITLSYITAAFEGTPVMRRMLKHRGSDAIELVNNITIEVRAASFRRLRGPTYVACICDEAAFWFDEGTANPDSEILNAIRPGLATTGGLLAVISSPYAKRGELFDAYRRYFGPDKDPGILVAKAASREMNPSLSQKVVDRALERDPAAARAEYLAEFRDDIAAFVAREAVESCVVPGVRERAPDKRKYYHAFADPSGGSSDSFTVCVGHNEIHRSMIVIDAVREMRPPFSPEAVVDEMSKLLQSYNIYSCEGDRYAGIWPVEQFARFGIRYSQAARPKTELYTDLLPHINSGRIELLDEPRLVSQLCGLERKTARGGRDSIDHAPNQHDDLANSVAGLAAVCGKLNGYRPDYGTGPDDEEDEREAARLERQKRNPHGLTAEHYARICSPVSMLPREEIDAAERQQREAELKRLGLEEIEKVRARERADAEG